MAADNPVVVAVAQPVAVLVEPTRVAGVAIAAGGQGPPGRDGVDGASLSPDAGNQLESRPNGLYAAPVSWAEQTW
ncbi:hypothetical protein [Metapseudomonas otitidis]|uniref:hypothetical protein n=1 Tax=Metapseudomonas otitidis TaxID=319939 RepID=UPI0024488A10|nr:hypothetical protein [Pseudomonas otitidis]MDH0334457.1 hypothetical protein [Pseudomonas otitidis]